MKPDIPHWRDLRDGVLVATQDNLNNVIKELNDRLRIDESEVTKPSNPEIKFKTIQTQSAHSSSGDDDDEESIPDIMFWYFVRNFSIKLYEKCAGQLCPIFQTDPMEVRLAFGRENHSLLSKSNRRELQ